MKFVRSILPYFVITGVTLATAVTLLLTPATAANELRENGRIVTNSEMTKLEHVNSDLPAIASGNFITTNSTSTQATRPVESGWWFDVPSIGLHQQMSQSYLNGSDISVPASGIGYFLMQLGNTFVLGHNTSTLGHIGTPSEIAIVRDGVKTTYHLKNAETTLVANTSMKKILNYQGVVVMTCAGSYDGYTGDYTHRLVMYYQ